MKNHGIHILNREGDDLQTRGCFSLSEDETHGYGVGRTTSAEIQLKMQKTKEQRKSLRSRYVMRLVWYWVIMLLIKGCLRGKR